MREGKESSARQKNILSGIESLRRAITDTTERFSPLFKVSVIKEKKEKERTLI